MITIHLFEQRKDLCLISFGDGLLQQRKKRFFIGMNTWRKPKRGGREVFNTIATAMLKGSACKGFHETGKIFLILVRLGEKPLRDRVGAERQRNSVDNRLDVASRRSFDSHRSHRFLSTGRITLSHSRLFYGFMFWFRWKRLSGSYFFLICTRRS